MAEETYNLEDYVYSQKLRFYNSERRENIGCNNVWTADERNIWANAGSTLGSYQLDLSTAFTDPLPLASFANGVLIGFTYDGNYTFEGDTYRATLRIGIFDQYNVEQYHYDQAIQCDYHWADIPNNRIPFRYSPPGFEYQLAQDESPTGFDRWGVVWSPGRYNLLWMGGLPDIEGDVELGGIKSPDQVWDRHVIGGISTDLDEFMSLIRDLGNDTPITPLMPHDDTSETGGGDKEDPDYNPLSDPINFPDLPIRGDSISTGFIRVYNPSGAQLQSLASVLWSDNFINNIKKIQNDPMEAIISLHSIPIGLVGTSSTCRIGNFDSGVAMPAITQQFYTVNLGSIYIPEHWASALDYSPYVTIDIYLPFVGVISVQVDDIIKRTVSVSYNIDIISGATVASIKSGESVLYTYNTNIILRHPISQSSYGPLYQSILGMVGNTVNGAVSGGIGGAVGGALGSAVNVALSKHSNISRGGSIGGATGVLGNFTPYLIIHRPLQSLASGFAHFKGYPSNITATIGSVSGYSEIESVHLTGIPCTDIERDEINALLYNGVIV